MSQAKFQKQQREKARREKAAAKFARRDERKAAQEEAANVAPTSPAEEAATLAELADLHARYDAGEVSFEDFEASRTELSGRFNIT